MPFVKKNELEELVDTPVPVVVVNPNVDITKYDPDRDHIQWTGFNYIEVYHFCPDADHRLHHEQVWIPRIGIIQRGTVIYRNPSGYYLKDEVPSGE